MDRKRNKNKCVFETTTYPKCNHLPPAYGDHHETLWMSEVWRDFWKAWPIKSLFPNRNTQVPWTQWSNSRQLTSTCSFLQHLNQPWALLVREQLLTWLRDGSRYFQGHSGPRGSCWILRCDVRETCHVVYPSTGLVWDSELGIARQGNWISRISSKLEFSQADPVKLPSEQIKTASQPQNNKPLLRFVPFLVFLAGKKNPTGEDHPVRLVPTTPIVNKAELQSKWWSQQARTSDLSNFFLGGTKMLPGSLKETGLLMWMFGETPTFDVMLLESSKWKNHLKLVA